MGGLLSCVVIEVLEEHKLNENSSHRQKSLLQRSNSYVHQALKKKMITVIANKGYFSRNNIKTIQALSVEENVPQTDTLGIEKKGSLIRR
jgi:tmRNA-binding protein